MPPPKSPAYISSCGSRPCSSHDFNPDRDAVIDIYRPSNPGFSRRQLLYADRTKYPYIATIQVNLGATESDVEDA